MRVTRSRRLTLAGLATLIAVPVLLGVAAPPAGAVDNCPDLRQVTPGNPLVLCSTSMYVDSRKIVHLLGELYNPGALVEAPAAVLRVQTSAGERTERVYPPFGWLDTGKRVPFDARLDGGVTVTGFQVVALEGLTPVSRPNNGFGFTQLRYSTGPADGQAVQGLVTNTSSSPVEGIKISYTAYDAAGRIAWYQPFIQTGNNRRVPPGVTEDFSIPRNDVPASARIDASSVLAAEGNEPAALLPGAPPQRALGTPGMTVPRSGVRVFPEVRTAPRDQPQPAGVPAPGPSARAGAATPGTVAPSHDAKPRRRAAGPLPSLIAEPVAAQGPTTTKTYAPVLLIAALGGLGLVLLLRQLAAFRGALAERRQQRRERAARAGRAGRGQPPGELADPDYVAPVSVRAGG